MDKANQILITCTILILIIGCKSENNTSTTSITEEDKKALKYLKEVEWAKAYAEQDTLLLDRILGDDFKMIDQSGNWYSKKDELDWIKENATSNDSFHYEIKRFEILENGTAIICGTGHILKDSINSIYQSSNVLVKRNGTWKAVLSHVSGFKNIEEK